MHHTALRRSLLVAAPLAALALTTATAAAYPTAGGGTLSGTYSGTTISGSLTGEVEIVDPVLPPVSQSTLPIADTCTLQVSGGTLSGACTGTVAIQMGGAYTEAGGVLVASGAAAVNTYDDVTLHITCTLTGPSATCAVLLQG